MALSLFTPGALKLKIKPVGGKKMFRFYESKEVEMLGETFVFGNKS